MSCGLRFMPMLGALVLLALPACNSTPPAPAGPAFTQVQALDVPNASQPGPGIFAGGQPSPSALRELSEQGLRHVVNLRPATEQEWAEGDLVESLGMQYHELPVDGVKDLTLANARTLDELLVTLEGEPVLLHCSSGNRVGALVAIAAYHLHGMGLEDALAEGRRWGLTRLEPAVRRQLSP